jgi:hypothetical protein
MATCPLPEWVQYFQALSTPAIARFTPMMIKDAR